jgi:hypothetical protein
MRSVETEPLTETRKAAVLEQLTLIVQSEFFRASRRCCSFLEYSVRYVLDGRSIDELKERTIGVEVFGKPADYDTAQDNVVRVTANEVRKRLAQYYGHGQQTQSPEIHLQIGSYAAYFEWTSSHSPAYEKVIPLPRPVASVAEPVLPALKPAARLLPQWPKLLAGLAGLLVLVLVALWINQRSTDVLTMVWSPILQSSKPAVISIAQPYAYRSTADVHAPLGPGDQVVPTPDAFVGIGDAFAMADIVELLSVREKEWQLIPSNVMPSRTLLGGPMILIGNRSNKWSREILANQRFYFGTGYEILDRSDPNAKWGLGHVSADWKTNEDFAIVSRFTNPASGQPVIVVAGITIYGTQAAGDFITNPTLLREALKAAPKKWKQGNFQFVLHTKVIENTPERPTVIAWNFPS